MTENSGSILILDDEFLVGLALADEFEASGFEVVGPYSNAEDATDSIEEQLPDAAILDFNLGRGETSEELAQRLKQHGVPFVFLTGYSSLNFDDEQLARVPRLGKPVRPSIILDEARRMLGKGR